MRVLCKMCFVFQVWSLVGHLFGFIRLKVSRNCSRGRTGALLLTLLTAQTNHVMPTRSPTPQLSAPTCRSPLTKLHTNRPDYTGLYRILQGYSGLYRVIQGFIHGFIQGYTGLYRAIQGYTGLYRVLYRVIQGYIG